MDNFKKIIVLICFVTKSGNFIETFVPLYGETSSKRMVFDCPCGKKNIITERGLSAHILLRHFGETENSFVCSVPGCKKSSFKGSTHIIEHFRNNHNQDERFDFLTNYAGPVQEAAPAALLEQVPLLIPDPNPANQLEQANPLAPFDQPRTTHQLLPILDQELGDFDDLSDDEDRVCPVYPSGNESTTSLTYLMAKRIVQHKKFYRTTEQAAISIAEDWRKFYEDLFIQGNSECILKKNMVFLKIFSKNQI